jgi:hypothetical protein
MPPLSGVRATVNKSIFGVKELWIDVVLTFVWEKNTSVLKTKKQRSMDANHRSFPYTPRGPPFYDCCRYLFADPFYEALNKFYILLHPWEDDRKSASLMRQTQ